MISNNKSYEYEFTDYDMVVIEKNDKKREKEIALNMLKMNLDIKIISQATDLTIEEIEDIKNSLK